MSARSRDSLFITSQLQSEWMRAGISFKVMLVGESGLGKTTFTRALLRPYVPEHLLDEPPDSVDAGPVRSRTAEITETVHKVENDGFPVEFSVVDCPGYGDAVDSTAWIDKIVGYITSRFAEHYEALGYPPRHTDSSTFSTGKDKLVHVCLYFIAAHRLKGVDLEFLKRLQPYVNLVPVIAKADTMTLAERDAFRRLVLSEFKLHGVRIFQMVDLSAPTKGVPPVATPTRDSEADATSDTPRTSTAPRAKDGGAPAQRPVSTTQPPPFAVSASEDGTRVYPWGTCYVEDPAHSDLSLLRSMLFAGSMLAAKRKTLALFEESYATRRRAAEAAEQARQRRAFKREVALGRCLMLLGVCGSVGGAMAVWRPHWLAACARMVDALAGRLARPGQQLELIGGLCAKCFAATRTLMGRVPLQRKS
ncbi:hypothetical protein AB1Y20_005346 [Prymnesium parvum]|uniref:Septin-type G domain-containing protein n=1 Tax=Prymnesium parvum TaxID=97485 RepID=A0AB34J3U6_PRYPA